MNSTQTALDVTGIAFALYHVSDIPRAKKFYGETLGLKLCAEMEFAPGQWWLEYDAGPGALALTNCTIPGANTSPSSGVALEVSNYAEALELVRAAGIELTWGPNECPVCHSFAIRDPDGNDLYIHQRKPHA